MRCNGKRELIGTKFLLVIMLYKKHVSVVWFGLVFVVFHCRNAIDSSLFKQWLHNLQSEIGILADGTLALRQVLIQVPGIVFARGPAVTVLILLESDGETYAVLTEQARVPTGRIILELPAGMLDDDKGDFVGTAVREASLSLHGLVVPLTG
ncbi:nudix hydrolase 14, chloroplastic-like [Arachis stenosperma]|uniref:nudix hydrolase 14, chloroplastic-like n=1 Tax=Arachis stenosperma TaxID=217475 RepID=UPI0025ABBFB3|nr:nudix hydrolase 14, chloroplastic-like [Arachis stenosperma]